MEATTVLKIEEIQAKAARLEKKIGDLHRLIDSHDESASRLRQERTLAVARLVDTKNRLLNLVVGTFGANESGDHSYEMSASANRYYTPETLAGE